MEHFRKSAFPFHTLQLFWPVLCPHLKLPCTPLLGAADYFCSPSGAIYSGAARSLTYSDNYFLEEYSKQYGRTYAEDEPNLRSLARRRLERSLLPRIARGDLLEIGCASGFFLEEARLAGFAVQGLEVSAFAAEQARSRGLDVQTGSFLEYEATRRFDVLAAFYVLEHFPDQREALERVSRLIKPGGFFLFALPSTNGPLFLCNREGWIKTHPEDHFADYSPRSLQRILPEYGLKVLHTMPASHHPERSCGLWRTLHQLHPELYRFFARRFSYGDTMDGIALKVC